MKLDSNIYYMAVGRPLVIGIIIIIILCLGEPDLLDAIIKFIMHKAGG